MWLKSTAGLNSFKRGTSVNLSRPVVLFDVPGRGRARHLTRYAYVQTVTWPCTLYVDTLDEAVRYQEALVSDLEDRCNVLEIKEDGKRVGWLKNVVARFNNGESLDATFTLTYEVAYKRKGWDASTPAADVMYTRLDGKPEKEKGSESMAAKETGNAQAEKVTASTFSKNDLIASAAVFNTTPAIMTGALYGVKKDELTKQEAADALAAFLKKPVHKGVK